MTREYKKYKVEELQLAIAESTTLSEACRKLGRKPVGGTISNMHLMCKKMGISTSHLLGQAHQKNKVSRNLKGVEERLVEGSPLDHRTEAKKLKSALIRSGVEYKCNKCDIVDMWNGEPLVLEIDHIDERYWNNKKENLQFLCPNCHAQKTRKRARVTQLV